MDSASCTQAILKIGLSQPKMIPNSVHLRSLYRSFLRELPHRALSNPSPIQQRIRGALSAVSQEEPTNRIEQAQQFIQYLKAQRMYVTLLERYNPGMSMDEEDRVKLTARRVGLDLPEEWRPRQKSWLRWNSLPCFGHVWQDFFTQPVYIWRFTVS